MPVVRAQRETRTAALPGVRKQAAETPTSTGVGLSIAKARTGEAIADVGGVVARYGVQEYGRVVQEEREKADTVALLHADNQLSTWEAQRLYHPTTGALTKQGPEAFGLPESVGEEYAKLTGDIEKTLNDRQRLRFASTKAQRGQSLDLTLRRHVFSEMQAYGRSELAAATENAHNEAVAKALDPVASASALNRGVDALKKIGPTLGLGPEAITKQVEALTSSTHDGVITRLLTAGYDRQADAYFEAHRGDITGTTLVQVEAKVKAGTTAAQGDRAAEAIWTELGPATDRDPIHLDRMEASARARFPEDPDARKATIAALRSRKQGIDEGRRERENAQSSAIWGGVYEGRSLDEIRHTEAFVNAPGEVQTRVADYFEREAAQAESRAATRESRAAAVEVREFNAETRAERTREMATWSTYLALSEPETLRDISRGELLERLPELGHAHVGRLLADQAKLAKDDETFRAAVIDRDLFNEIMHDAGVPGVYMMPGRRKPAQAADLGKLLSTIEESIGRAQVKAGRRLTREETGAVARETVDQRVMVKDGWFSNDVRFPALVRIEDVPAADQAAIREALGRRGITAPSPQDVIDIYVRTLPKVK